MSDPQTIAIAVFGTASAVLGVATYIKADAAQFWKNGYVSATERLDAMSQRLAEFERKDAVTRLHRSSAGKKGRAVQLARQADTAPEREAAAQAARAKTLAEFSGTPMRSRRQVVAPVKAKRTKQKNKSGAGVAATQGG